MIFVDGSTGTRVRDNSRTSYLPSHPSLENRRANIAINRIRRTVKVSTAALAQSTASPSHIHIRMLHVSFPLSPHDADPNSHCVCVVSS